MSTNDKPQSVPRSVFDTVDLAPNQRIDAYRANMSVIFDTQDFQAVAADFGACLESYLIDDLLLVDCQTIAQTFTRSNAMIGKDGMDHYLIQLFLFGATVFDRSAKEMVCDSSALIVIDAARSWKAFNPDFRNLTLVIPRRLLRPLLWNEDGHHGRIMHPAHNPFAEILHWHILGLRRAIDRIDSRMAGLMVSSSVNLAASALNYAWQMERGSAEWRASPPQEHAMLFAIKSFIEANLKSTSLGEGLIQKKFRLTKPTLHRLFAEHGGVVNYIHERRLIQAFKHLSIPANSHKLVNQIASDIGFTNELAFVRDFKNRFGLSPKDLRQDGGGASLSADRDRAEFWRTWLVSL